MTTTLASLLDDYARLRAKQDDPALTPDKRSRAEAPAKPDAIAELEKKLGIPLPPSYREFLQVHDGWANFRGATWIGGTFRSESRTYVEKQLKVWRQLNGNGLPDEPNREYFRPSDHVVLGADNDFGVLAFGRKAGRDGEREVLGIANGVVESRWPSFRAFAEDEYKKSGGVIREEPAAEPPKKDAPPPPPKKEAAAAPAAKKEVKKAASPKKEAAAPKAKAKPAPAKKPAAKKR
jgi:hypothetical protein